MLVGENVVCPFCRKEFVLCEVYEKGNTVWCPACKSPLNVISVRPAELELKSSKKQKESILDKGDSDVS